MRGCGGGSGDWSARQSEGGGASGTVRRQAWSVAEGQQHVLFDHKLAIFVCFCSPFSVSMLSYFKVSSVQYLIL